MVAALAGMALTSCEDFLDRPTEDSYTTNVYYKTDAQIVSAINYLYNSPWYDFQRGFFKVGEVLSGNYYWGSSPYLTFAIKGDDEDLSNMSASLWAVISHSNTVYDNIKAASDPSEAVKNQCLGELLTWKAMAYFYLVRTFGEVPLIHSNNDVIASGNVNDQYKVEKGDIYEYICMTLEKAVELLPTKCAAGRIDKYVAKGLMAKVYLTKAGVSGQLDQADLQKAAEYAQDVMDNSGRALMPVYSDIFRGSNNNCDEIMLAWRWTVGAQWTCQNTFQSDLAIVGFDEYGDVWGGWGGPSVDLQDAFGVSCMDDPANRVGEADSRRKATMMLPGDKYEYFWADKGGFDLLRFMYDDGEYGKGGPGGSWQCPSGAFSVKHLYGNDADHQREMGMSAARMASALCTPILRLSDVYLVLAEAKVLMGQGSDAKALEAFNAVRCRAIAGETPKTSLTFADVWKERRLELACEGDRWYDFVRLSYYNMDAAISELKSQRRNSYNGLDAFMKTYYNKGEYGAWPTEGTLTADGAVITFDKDAYGDNIAAVYYDTTVPAPNVTAGSFVIPLPSADLVYNKHLSEPAIHVDVRNTYSY